MKPLSKLLASDAPAATLPIRARVGVGSTSVDARLAGKRRP